MNVIPSLIHSKSNKKPDKMYCFFLDNNVPRQRLNSRIMNQKLKYGLQITLMNYCEGWRMEDECWAKQRSWFHRGTFQLNVLVTLESTWPGLSSRSIPRPQEIMHALPQHSPRLKERWQRCLDLWRWWHPFINCSFLQETWLCWNIKTINIFIFNHITRVRNGTTEDT